MCRIYRAPQRTLPNGGQNHRTCTNRASDGRAAEVGKAPEDGQRNKPRVSIIGLGNFLCLLRSQLPTSGTFPLSVVRQSPPFFLGVAAYWAQLRRGVFSATLSRLRGWHIACNISVVERVSN
jgi:hypothetical protein